VSIVRAGECLEPALSEVYKDAKIGKILIQTNQLTGEPEVEKTVCCSEFFISNK
jgi:uridine kinase